MSSVFDIGPLSWVKSEIDSSLARAKEALRVFGGRNDRRGELEACGMHLHQAAGAVQIVGLEGVSRFFEETEKLVAELAAGKVDAAGSAPQALERAIGAIGKYLSELLEGAPDQPMRLFPEYRQLAHARAAPAPSEAELYFPDLTLPAPPHERPALSLAPEQAQALLRAQRARYQQGLVHFLRDPSNLPAIAEMRAAVDAVESTQSVPVQRAFWWAAGALFDALAHGDLASESSGIKPLCSRIEQQLRRVIEGSPSVAERLMREVLFWVASAGERSARARTVKDAYRLEHPVPVPTGSPDISQRMPVAHALREALAGAKESWNRFAAGAESALAAFAQHAEAIAAQGERLGNRQVAVLTAEIGRAARELQAHPSRMSEVVAMEIATALLLAENAADNYRRLPEDFERQVKVMGARLRAAVLSIDSTSPLPTAALVDEMTRRAQEKLAVNSALAEMQANLHRIEQALDAYFRDPAKAGELATLESLIHQVSGALRVLGEERAEQALERCAATIRGFAAAATRPSTEQFEDVAQILSGLGFYIEALRHGKADFTAAMRPVRVARSAPPPEAAAPSVEIELEQKTRDALTLLERFKGQRADERLRAEIKHRLDDIRKDAELVADRSLGDQARETLSQIEAADNPDDTLHIALKPEPEPQAAGSAHSERLKDASDDALDQELLVIFLEEAVEVLATIASNLEVIRAQPASTAHLATTRRAFHTLKGSGRMVGLTRLGEAAWAVEQVMNLWLQEERSATSALCGLLAQAHEAFSDWIARLHRGEAQPDPQEIIAAATRVRLGEGTPAPAAAAAVHAPAVLEAPATPAEERPVVLGDAQISPSLFAVFVNEARQHLDTLERELAATLLDKRVRDELVRAAHTFAGICGTVQLGAMHALGYALENALLRLRSRTEAVQADELELLGRCIAALSSMYAGVLERHLPAPQDRLCSALELITGPAEPLVAPVLDDTAAEPREAREEKPDTASERGAVIALAAAGASAPANAAAETIAEVPIEAAAAEPELLPVTEDEAPPSTADLLVEEIPIERRQRRLDDDIDPQLLPVFLEEAGELAPRIGELLRAWRGAPASLEHANALRRALHTLKGSARMAGVMSLGELTHLMETRVEDAVALNSASPRMFDDLETSTDRIGLLLERLQRTGRALAEAPAPAAAESQAVPPVPEPRPTSVLPQEAAHARGMMRVRAQVLEKLVNQTGEVAIARSRIEGEVRALKGALADLTENVGRLRGQLREIEIQAESQMRARSKEIEEQHGGFDPLEFDRFTRVQELTRMMAESVNDVSTVHQSITRVVDDTDAALSAQARLTRELQQDLMRVRMVPLGSIAQRLHRLVRQSSKELGKRAQLELRGGGVELDRSVLERITAPLEHLIRNAITHGLEVPAARAAAGKSEIGEIRLDVRQEGNEVVLTLADDGAGLDLERIRSIALAKGLLRAGETVSSQRLADLIFVPGFSTAENITEVAGRGVGTDVVKDEVGALGGRVEIATASGRGAKFTIRLPLTTAVTQTVLVRSGARICALPAVMVEQLQQLRADALDRLRAAGHIEWAGRQYGFAYLPELLGETGAASGETRRYSPVLLLRAGMESIALQVDEMIGNQEVVVKNLGPQLERVPGVAGVTVLGSGEIVLVLNPVVLAGRPRPSALASERARAVAIGAARARVMVVDDSLTVRKITGRLLAREGYQVITAKDGVEALEQLAEMVPDVMLVDIEMPRMDGFDLTRNVRADERLRAVPIVMITSRIADKHRSHALELGVNVFLGKPYQEDELLAHIAGFVSGR